MRWFVVLTALLLLTATASALDYEDKPNITVFLYGSNYFERGDEKNIVLTVFNDAVNKKIEYANPNESAFFNGREDMLFTAYDIKLQLEGNDYVEVKTPEQRIPALPPMSPLTVSFLVKISDNAEAGEYTLDLNVEYYQLDELKEVKQYQQLPPLPEQDVYEIKNGQVTGNGTRYSVYKYLTQTYELEYIRKTKTIPIKIYIEEKPVRLEVLKVEGENLVGGAKGRITVMVKNLGDKTARNAYLVLDTPSGFEAQGLSVSTASAMPSGMPAGMPTGMTSIPTGMPTGMYPAMPSAGMATTVSSAKAAYYVGDLKPGDAANATFYLKINVKDGGTYPLQIKAVYLDEFGKLTESDSTTFGVEVRDAPEITVKSTESRVYVNAKGEVEVTLLSDTDLKDASVRISASSPLSVLSSEYYVGEIKAGEEFKAVFKLKASSEAKPVTYPADITLVYRSMDEYVELDPVRIGVKVNPKMEFEVVGQPSIAAGEEKVVTFVIKNVGEFEVRDATARITIVDPFSSTDDSAFIGDLKPGEAANATFKISVDGDATPKLYALNLEVKYKDAEGEWAYSEPAKAIINVTPAKPPYMLYAVIAIIVIAAIAVYLKRR